MVDACFRYDFGFCLSGTRLLDFAILRIRHPFEFRVLCRAVLSFNDLLVVERRGEQTGYTNEESGAKAGAA